MPEPPPRRKPATELEAKISAGDASVVGALVDLLDERLHRHLVAEFPIALCEADREELISSFIADLVESPANYRVDRASIEHYAKVCVKRKAIDLLRRRGTQRQYELGPGASAVLRLAVDETACDMDLAIIKERAKVAVESFDPKYKAALHAVWQFGPEGYRQALMDQFGITGNAAAQWLSRARRMLEEALGSAVRLEP
ncbi:MAG: sigma-70 family RNA polymerase sigma factor [Phycisphaerales bacterium]|nr:sigma-70 family RNA polymerase sigma factor [Phycisphaerales bacterium]